MSHINWDATLHFDPHDPLNAFATHGIPVPTYGNYGGAGYTAGQFGVRTPEPSQLTPETQPVDQLDQLFYQHDLVHQHLRDGTATFSDVVTADIILILGMAALDYTDPGNPNYDPEAGLYEGLSTFATVLKLETELKSVGSDITQLPNYSAIVSDTQEAFVNFTAGLAEAPSEARTLHAALPLFEHHFHDLLI
jgi:hypothetical protein